ncbi:acetate--CoA ligase family protein [Mesorhizobium sp. M0933]|uniref:acetate--CoA ligase family protein n=1 Tax=Mesorhizobium sp. M0933 TaxID=2957030 RepID=UPI0033388689
MKVEFLSSKTDRTTSPSAMFDLSRLLAPRSVALVGASPRKGSMGHNILEILLSSGYGGKVFPVNPKYQEIEALKCYGSLEEIEDPVDLVAVAVASQNVQPVFESIYRTGAGSALLFDRIDDRQGGDLQRLRSQAIEHALPILGGNCMGYHNFLAKTSVTFNSSRPRQLGGIAAIAHSGSVFTQFGASDPRFRFNLLVSTGQEIAGSVGDYMDYALNLPSTRALVLFIESVRDPEAFRNALEKARARRIPVVVSRVGRTNESAALAASHTGAIAGSNAGYEAVFEHYGVLEVDTPDDLLTSGMLLAQCDQFRPGSLAAVADSGGLRELLIDMADQLKVPFAKLTQPAISTLKGVLPAGLPATNPLDAGGPNNETYVTVFRRALEVLVQEADAAICMFEFDATDFLSFYPELSEIAKDTKRTSPIPFFVLNSLASALNEKIAEDLTDAGVVVINGMRSALVAVRNFGRYRDYLLRENSPRQGADTQDSKITELVAKWRSRLISSAVLSEFESLELLDDFGIATVRSELASNVSDAVSAADRLGYPIALKTAEKGIHHKTDVGGVKLGIVSQAELEQSYHDLRNRLGPDVILQPMTKGRLELAFGMVRDSTFGPLVMLSAGGENIELLNDRTFALPTVDHSSVVRMFDRLAIRRRFDAHRGKPAIDVGAVARIFWNFCTLCRELGDLLDEVDINPIIVDASGCRAVDALVVSNIK